MKGSSFNLFWGHHLGEKELKALLPNQAVNHYPGSFGLGRKDYLWKNMSRMQRMHGDAYDFCAKSYLFPRDREQFERDYEEGDVYIVKPPAQAEGRGIRLINRSEQLPAKGTAAIVQRYLGDPYLINNKKFDLRIYVAVTSFDPLRIYVFEEGLARFATTDYQAPDASKKSIKNRYMHLTNYSINKKSDDFEWNTDFTRDDVGSKWSLSALYRNLEKAGVDVPPLRERINDLIIKTVIAVEHSVVSKMNAFCNGRAACYELFGFDVLLDAQLKPWLIEVNVSCSLASSSPLDKWIKTMLMTDLFHLIGVIPFDRKAHADEAEKKKKARLLKSSSEPLKRRNVFELQDAPLSSLDDEDKRLIMCAEDELRRRGHFKRVLPCDHMAEKYGRFFEFPRYRNTVLSKWMASQDWSLLARNVDPAAFGRIGFPAEARPRAKQAPACDAKARGRSAAPVAATHRSVQREVQRVASPGQRREPDVSTRSPSGLVASRSAFSAGSAGAQTMRDMLASSTLRMVRPKLPLSPYNQLDLADAGAGWPRVGSGSRQNSPFPIVPPSNSGYASGFARGLLVDPGLLGLQKRAG